MANNCHDLEVIYLSDDYLSHEEEITSDSNSNSGESVPDLIPLPETVIVEKANSNQSCDSAEEDWTVFDTDFNLLNLNENHNYSSQIDQLPDDAWLEIFSYLSGKDILSVRTTNKRFNQLIESSSKFTEKITLQIQNSHLIHSQLDTLLNLQFRYSNVYIDDLALINEKMNDLFWRNSARFIKNLKIENIFITPDFLTIFKNAVYLESLTVINCDFVDIDFDLIDDVYYQKLREINLVQTRNSRFLLKFFDSHSGPLETLNFQCNWKTHQGYNIDLLRLINNNKQKLRHLTISDDGKILKDITKISLLRLHSFTHYVRNTVREYTNDDIIQFIKNQRQLRTLNMDCSSLLPELVQYLPKLEALNTEIFVKIENITRSPVNLFHLNGLRRLTKLNLHIHQHFDFVPIGKRIFPLNLRNLQECSLHFSCSNAYYSSMLISKIPYIMPNLRVLKLVNIYSNNLPYIFRYCKNLRELCLVKYEDGISTSKRFIFKHIKKLVNLEKLELYGFTNLINGSTIRTKFIFPKLRVLKIFEKEPIFRFYSEDLNVMFRNCPQIRELYFSNSIIMNFGIIYRSKYLRNLEVLHVEDVYCFSTSSLFRLVNNCKKLRSLYVPPEVLTDFNLRIVLAKILIYFNDIKYYTGFPHTELYNSIGKSTPNTAHDIPFVTSVRKSISYQWLCSENNDFDFDYNN